MIVNQRLQLIEVDQKTRISQYGAGQVHYHHHHRNPRKRPSVEAQPLVVPLMLTQYRRFSEKEIEACKHPHEAPRNMQMADCMHTLRRSLLQRGKVVQQGLDQVGLLFSLSEEGVT
jgi:hypothetical protein